MDITQLLEPMVKDGIRNTHFFNGRVLTAEDLRTEQRAGRDQRRQLGRALGAGVVHGFEVTRRDPLDGIPALRILAGLAFNRDGDAVELGRDVDLRLVQRSADIPEDAALFAVCRAPEHPLELTNVGLYVLTARPASAFSRERAPMTDLNGGGVAAGCGSRWAVEGVRFSVAPLPLAAEGTTPTPLALQLAQLATQVDGDIELRRSGGAAYTEEIALRLATRLSRLRNGAAYLCFGVDAHTAHRARPLPVDEARYPDPAYGALDGMRARAELESCDVPLAVLYLSREGVEWVDAWSARRPPVPAVTAGTLPVIHDARRHAEALAMLLQFQRHAADLVADAALSVAQLGAAQAQDWFRFLPPFGLLPVAQTGGARGFAAGTFFNAFSLGAPVQIRGARLPRLGAEAMLGPPVDLGAPGAVELYRVQENVAPAAGAPYVVFVNRDTQGLRARDMVAAVLQETWSAYHAFLRRGQFMPMTTTVEAMTARLALAAAVHGVMGVALQGAAMAGARSLPNAETLQAFSTLRTLQLEFADLLQMGMAGIPDTQGRVAFASQLRTLLTGTIPGFLLAGGHPGLGPALTQGSVTAAVRAQQVINEFLGRLQGNIDVEFEEAIPETPTAGEPVTFRFTVRNRSSSALTASLLPRVSISEWEPLLETRLAVSGPPVSSIALGAEPRDVFVVISAIPEDAEGTDFTVRLDVQAGSSMGTSGDRAFTVGEVAEMPDPAIVSFALTSAVPTSALQGGNIVVPAGTTVRAVFNLVVNTAASYTVSVEPVDELTGWTIGIIGAPSATPTRRTFPITAAELTGPGGTTSRTPEVGLIVGSAAQSSGQIRVSVMREGQEVGRTVTVNVARA